MRLSERSLLMILLVFVITVFSISTYAASNNIPTSAIMTTDLAGGSESSALPSVFRVICPKENKSGTGFLHKSGKIITAFHVVADCSAQDIILVGVQKQPLKIVSVVVDEDFDLALLTPSQLLKEPTLTIGKSDQNIIGSQVSTWGYPAGYNGFAPLLSSGYLSGTDILLSPSGKPVTYMVVNAAFNSGNSGGPLVKIDNNQVIGVVASKLAPLPDYIEKCLNALKKNNSGMMYTKTNSDGSKEEISEAQVTEMILQYLRSQTQLVIGYAVQAQYLRTFLKAHNVEP
jgi:S1-C subfamily serine protease